jgi:2-polyprenyl-6-methoxyphenol hydroxylase-like FAD-dependent oxidoreductase
MRRAELHDALASAVPAEIVHLGKKLVCLDQPSGQVTLHFEDGSSAKADAVVGADGVHSIVRDIVVGPDASIHKVRIDYRAVCLAGERLRYWTLSHEMVGY